MLKLVQGVFMVVQVVAMPQTRCRLLVKALMGEAKEQMNRIRIPTKWFWTFGDRRWAEVVRQLLGDEQGVGVYGARGQ